MIRGCQTLPIEARNIKLGDIGNDKEGSLVMIEGSMGNVLNPMCNDQKCVMMHVMCNVARVREKCFTLYVMAPGRRDNEKPCPVAPVSRSVLDRTIDTLVGILSSYHPSPPHHYNDFPVACQPP